MENIELFIKLIDLKIARSTTYESALRAYYDNDIQKIVEKLLPQSEVVEPDSINH